MADLGPYSRHWRECESCKHEASPTMRDNDTLHVVKEHAISASVKVVEGPAFEDDYHCQGASEPG